VKARGGNPRALILVRVFCAALESTSDPFRTLCLVFNTVLSERTAECDVSEIANPIGGVPVDIDFRGVLEPSGKQLRQFGASYKGPGLQCAVVILRHKHSVMKLILSAELQPISIAGTPIDDTVRNGRKPRRRILLSER
jgi:hypothetical protein